MRRVIAVLVLAAGACASPDPSTIDLFVTSDARVVAEPARVASGETIVRVENDDEERHRIVLARTRRAPGGLPVREGRVRIGKESDVTFDGDGYRVLVKLEPMRAYFSGPQRVTAIIHTYLEPGTYELFCSLPGHYERGEHTTVVAT